MGLDVELQNIDKCLKGQKFDDALSAYYDLFSTAPDFFLVDKNTLSATRQHIRNAANLARKNGYERVSAARNASTRLAQAIDRFFGLLPVAYDLQDQKPNFFYIPNLPSKPFYEPKEIAHFEAFLQKLQIHQGLLLALLKKQKENYVELMGRTPDTRDWRELKNQKWLSLHLLKGSVRSINDLGEMEGLYTLFEDQLIADCPPHGPEVFISQLAPTAYIPEHFGISNVKLTAHFPINVNSKCSLTVSGQTKYWDSNLKGIVFDDSFIHSAKNQGTSNRSVLIFDLWNPNLDLAERAAIRLFMSEHHKWSLKFGKLAGLDRDLNAG
jgi:hypothetical protein